MDLDISSILSYINFPELQRILFFLKVFSAFLTLFFVIAIILILARTQYLKLMFAQDWKEFLTYRVYGNRKMTDAWAKVIKRLKGAQESEYKLAILEADEMLDDVLKKMGFAGETPRERLEKVTPEIISSLEQLKEARKVRDNILYDPDFRLTQEQSQKALESYEQAFRDLGVL